MQDRQRPLLMLIDGPSLVYRGYFALPPLTMSDGTLVNAVFGFLQIVLRGMQDLKPDYAIVSFDLGRPQFRFQAYPEYKAGRPSMPDDLRAQFPIVREICQMMGIPIRELEGYEADDVIGSLVQRAREADVDTMIVSGDLDGLQLLPDEEVKAQLVAQRGLGEWTADWFLARHLARPQAWPAGDLGLRKAVAARAS